MHWHPNADEWLYILKGTGRATVFNTGPQAMTADFHPGDIGYIKKAFGHYLENTGNTDMVYHGGLSGTAVRGSVAVRLAGA